MCIIAAVFAIITPVLYIIILSVSGGSEIEEYLAMEMLGSVFSAKTQFFSAFSIGNNFGLIAPVLLAIVLCKDFSFGTIRNKIIAGKKRSSIFMSLFITCSTVFVGIMLFHSFFTLGVSLIFFDYQSTAFTLGDLRYFLVSLLFEILVLLFISALLSYLCANMKNVGLAIVLYVAISFALVMIGSVVQVALAAIMPINVNETVSAVLEFIDKINIGTASSRIGVGNTYSFEDVLYNTLPSVIGIAGFLGLGILKFKKKDLK